MDDEIFNFSLTVDGIMAEIVGNDADAVIRTKIDSELFILFFFFFQVFVFLLRDIYFCCLLRKVVL